MRGLFLRRAHPEAEAAPTTCTITVTGTGNRSGCYVTINGTNVTSAGTYEVETGDVIYCYARNSAESAIYLNNMSVVYNYGGAASYEHIVTKDTAVSLWYSSSAGVANVRINE